MLRIDNNLQVLKMITEALTKYHISYQEFREWAEKHSWLCIHREEHDFGRKYAAAPHLDEVDIGMGYVYLTPSGNKMTVIVKQNKVQAVV